VNELITCKIIMSRPVGLIRS